MIKNTTSKKILASRYRTMDTIVTRAIGLMFSRKIDDFGLVFEFRKPLKIDLHMFFVFFPIDAIFLDSERKVVEIKEDFRPFTIYNPKKKANYVIELPEGTIRKTGTQVGDKIDFISLV